MVSVNFNQTDRLVLLVTAIRHLTEDGVGCPRALRSRPGIDVEVVRRVDDGLDLAKEPRKPGCQVQRGAALVELSEDVHRNARQASEAKRILILSTTQL